MCKKIMGVNEKTPEFDCFSIQYLLVFLIYTKLDKQ